ncbi:hypothetical protein Tco_0749815 [Tanacetum coccineum]|uniref:Uncharacterized protein n=1 Tax=Tanacetum coccineum TaxID=301880 RepID=A0ABQ4YZH2_9ASTR
MNSNTCSNVLRHRELSDPIQLVASFFSNSPIEENEKGRKPYLISAHLTSYLTRLRCATSDTTRPGTKSANPVCIKGEDPVKSTHTSSPPSHERKHRGCLQVAGKANFSPGWEMLYDSDCFVVSSASTLGGRVPTVVSNWTTPSGADLLDENPMRGVVIGRIIFLTFFKQYPEIVIIHDVDRVAPIDVWICQISQEISQKRTRERMSDQEAKEIKAEAREIMPQPSTVNQSPSSIVL